MRVLILMILAGVGLAEEPLLRMASEGRMSISGVKMEKVDVSAGSAVNDDGDWVLSFPIDWWKWREVKVKFHPGEDGVGELHLSGPWAMEGKTELRQEVLWGRMDDESFEKGVLPEEWSSPWREYPKTSEWPIDGRDLVASWHGRPLAKKVSFKKGQPLSMILFAKAAMPPEFVQAKRLSVNTPAHRAASKLKRGVNLGNCWEGPPGSGAVSFSVDDVDRMAKAGFDHVRVPVGWHHRLNDGKPSPEFLSMLEPVLKRALKKDLAVILNWQSFDALCDDPSANSERFVKGWAAIAAHFKAWPEELIFELFNEPHGKLEGEMLNRMHASVIRQIRLSNPARILMVDPGAWASSDAMGLLRLPDEDERIIVSIHCYDPFRFTHQGADWVGLGDVKDVTFDGELPGVVRRRLDDALAWSRYFGRPVHLGEFGAYRTADDESRKRYAEAIVEAAEERGIPWCWWEWKAGFGCWDSKSEKSLLIEVLTGS